MRRLSCALLLAAVVGAAPARADDAVSVALNVGHATPGAVVHVVVTPSCTATAVRVSLAGASAAGDESGTTAADADAELGSSGSWLADLLLPTDLAAPQHLSVSASATCPTGGVAGSAALRVDAFDTQRVQVSPGAAAVGEQVRYAMTGGRGSCWSASVTDSDGAAWSLFTAGPPQGTPLNGSVHDGTDASRVSGGFAVPPGMALGSAVLTVHCSQTVDRPGRFDVLPPVAADDPAGATTTAAPRRTGSRVTLGGGLPVVTGSPVEVDPRFPLPTLAPPLPVAAAPVLVAAVPVATGGSSTSVWWLLLGVLPVVASAALLARRRRQQLSPSCTDPDSSIV